MRATLRRRAPLCSGEERERRGAEGSGEREGERKENLYVPCNIWTKFTLIENLQFQLGKAMSRNKEVVYCKKEITKELILTCTFSLLGC